MELNEKQTRRSFVRLLGTAAAVLPLAACGLTTADLQNDLNEIKTACLLIPIGTSLIATLISSIPLAVNIAPITTTIGNTVQSDCEAFVTDIQNAINVITQQGGTATVTVSSANASASALRRLAKLAASRYPGASFGAVGLRSVTFTVAPHAF